MFDRFSMIVWCMAFILCLGVSVAGAQITKTPTNTATVATTATTTGNFVLVAPNGQTYQLVKLFDKPTFAANETIVSYQVDQQGNIVGVETNLSVYKLVAQ